MASVFSLGHVTLSAYRSLAKTLKSGVLLFWGAEDYMKQLELSALRARLDPDTLEFNHIKLDFARDATLEELQYEVSAFSMMGGCRLIEVRGLDILSLRADDEKKLLAALDSMDDDTIVVLYFPPWELELNKKNKTKKIIRSLEECAAIVEFPLQTNQTIIKLFTKKALSEGMVFPESAIEQMIQQVGSSLLLLRLEYDKLAMYARHNQRREITIEDVKTVCSANPAFNLNQLPDAVCWGDRHQAITVFRQLVAEKTEPTIIVATLSRAIATMIATLSGEHRGYNRKEIATTLGSFDWLIGKYSGYVKRFTPAQLSTYLAACVEADTRIKSSGIDPYLVCEQLLYTLTGR